MRGGVGDEWPLATLAGHGISALCINAPPSVLDAVIRFEIGRSAIESAIALLSSRGEIEPGNVGMGGLSYGTEVSRSDLQPGDLVFFQDYGYTASHVGIYIGGDQFIHASSSYYNGHCVVITSLSETYYNNHYLTARRH